MRVTRRAWGAAFVGLFLLGLGLLLQRPLLLVGAALVGAWLLAVAGRFVLDLDRTLDEIELEQRVERDRVVTRRDLAVTLSASVDGPSALDLTIESRPPAGTTTGQDGPRRVGIEAGRQRAESTYLASWPHAGTVTFDPPSITATDRLGLFEETFSSGPAPSVTVTPRTPREIHVGIGGEPIAAAYGDHRAGRSGSGLEPAELREYVPGDAADRIDWKATARLAEPYVREFEVETDRRTVLVVDHRSGMGLGPEGETQLDYLREVALAYLESARAFDDPFGCYTVGDEGITGRWLPEVGRQPYAKIRQHLGRLEPTTAVERPTSARTRDPADARRVADRLRDDSSAFGRTLGPFFEQAEPYVNRIAGDPLYGTVRSIRETLRGSVWTVLFTDDSQPGTLSQAVSVAQRGEGRVLVYLTPSVLFEPGGLTDLEAAYERYVEFEDLRRDLARRDGVDAFEVAPGDRVEAVLSAGRQRRRPSVAAGGG
jgi:uncharacterized protein (DUF58 family)